jgi:hypothetical protein
MIKYPEILAWEYQWRQAKEELAALIYHTIKSIKPDAEVGRHIDSKGTTLDPVTRAGTDYKAMAAHSDFIKPILYQDVMGARLYSHYLQRYTRGALHGLPMEAALDFLEAFNDYPKGLVPEVEVLGKSSLPPQYVALETKRLVNMVEGEAHIYPGIGMNVPHREGKQFIRTPDEPESVYQAVIQSFEAGATGIVACREYDEMRVPTLQAFGRAVKDWNRG